jgi:DNA-binding response OmpR family regulator
MPNILILEPDRISAKCIEEELVKRNFEVYKASSAETAVAQADKLKPDLVICELSLPGHSGSEFIYEFRTYTDWKNTPMLIYSSIKVPNKMTKSRDWELLSIARVLYKPDFSLKKLGELVEDLIRL